MRLTPDLFEYITGFKESSLEQLHAKSKEDQRAVSRLPLAFRALACRIDGSRFDDPIQVQICDISVADIGLTHSSEDRLGKTFVIALKPHGKGSLIAIHCEMVNFESAGQTHIRVGAKFVRLGTDQDIRHCMTPAPPVPASPVVATMAGPAAKTLVPNPDEVKRIRDAMLL